MKRVASSALLVSIGLLIALLPLVTGQRFAFRDVSHFYLPLYDYVAMRCHEQWLPLWNPLDHAGMPLVGESTTAVLYPIRYLIFALPMSPVLAMNLYLITHVSICAWSAGWLAHRFAIDSRTLTPTNAMSPSPDNDRWWNSESVTAATAYSLSGSVFALCCNPPFLVGAAWMPFFLGSVLFGGQAKSKVRSRIVIAATSLAMMVLAGDPQMALHCVLVVTAVSLFRLVRRETRLHQASTGIVLVASLGLALGMTAIQIAASLDWSRISDRVLSPRQHGEIYAFSFPPWHLAEIVAAKSTGDPFPSNQRISRLVAGDGRMWTPSIYAGTLVGLALLCRLADWRRWFSDPWLGIAACSLSLSMGEFGSLWWLQQITTQWDHTSSAVGGLYWMLVEFLPGYDSFRYPAKWLPFFSIAAAMLASIWIKQRVKKSELAVASIMVIASMAGAATCQWLSGVPNWLEMHSRNLSTGDEYWGALDIASGFRAARNSWLLSAALTGVTMVLRLMNQSSGTRKRPFDLSSIALVCTLLLDCSLHARGLLPRVDINSESEIAQRAITLRDQKMTEETKSTQPTRLRAMRTQQRMWPAIWSGDLQRRYESQRVFEVAVTERAVWLGRWHLAERQGLFNSMVSVRSQAMSEFWRLIPSELQRRSERETDSRDTEAFWSSFRHQVGIDSVCHVDANQTLPIEEITIPKVVRVKTDSIEMVRAYDHWRPPRPMKEWLRSLGTQAETDLPEVDFPSSNMSSDITLAEKTLVENEPPSKVQTNPDGTIDVWTTRGCLLERHQFQDGNWQAIATEQNTQCQLSLTVLPSRHFNQAIRLPAGKWCVEFEYRPWWVVPSVVVSLIGWSLLLVIAVWQR
ncbi:MAG: hypothetical protein AAF745_14070 [Planctomycetota bacterium]